MMPSQLPAVYQSADSGSNSAQRTYLWNIKSEYGLLILLAALGEFRTHHPAVILAIIMIVVLLFGLLIFRFVTQLDRKWYACRALAESVKTSAWKFAMRAHPYEDCERVQIAVRNFLTSLNQIRKDNEFIGNELDARFADKDQITPAMMDIRALPIEDRLSYYITNRVKEQRIWYSKKAHLNSRRRKQWFGLAILVYTAAAASLLSEPFGGPDVSFMFAGLLVFVTSSFAWIQVKRHGELAASYTLTAHEIGAIQGISIEVASEKELSDFVNAAEFAFSREHTQWSARRDSV